MQDRKFTINEILEITKGKLLQKGKDYICNISTDSRNIEQDSLFLPLIGENFDGHNFIKTAFEKGANATLIQKNSNYTFQDGKTFIEVEDTLRAYQQFANNIRKKINPITIAITGSSGKTSTKEIVFSFVSKYFSTVKSLANHNNEIGVPQTLFRLENDTNVCIVEMGMRGKNQITELCKVAEPNIGIITNLGTAHIELLGSKEEIAKAKWELSEYLEKQKGTIILPAYNENLKSLAKNYSSNIIWVNLEDDNISTLVLKKDWIEDEKQYFTFLDKETNKETNVCLSLLGKHQVSNALLALALAKPLKIRYPEFLDLTSENLSGRNEFLQMGSIKILNDSYNANPESMKASIETFVSIKTDLKKILVLGEMRELGDYSEFAHREIGKFCSSLEFEKLIVVGKNAKGIEEGFLSTSKNKDNIIFFENNEDTANYLKKFLDKEIYLLLKASRGAKLEEIIKILSDLK